jgi:poly(hydroxyalkanoate) granule-associated protein
MAKKGWQKDVSESAHKIWLAGLGALAVAEEEGSKLFSNLVHEGERFETKGKVEWKDVRREAEKVATRAREGAESALGKVEKGLDEQLARTLHRVGVPTRDEISALARRVEELTHAVERLRARQSGTGGAKAAAAKTGGAKTGGARTAAKAGAKARASKPAATKTAAARPARAKGAAGRKRSPLPAKITTAKDVTTTADVRTAPR